MGEVKISGALNEDGNLSDMNGDYVLRRDYDALRAENDELVAALEFVGAKLKSSGRCHPNAAKSFLVEGLEAVDAAIAKHRVDK